MVVKCPILVKWKPEYGKGILIQANGMKAGALDTGAAAAEANQLCVTETIADPPKKVDSQAIIASESTIKGVSVSMTFGKKFDEVDVNRVRISLTRKNCEFNPTYTDDPDLYSLILIETSSGRAVAQTTDTAAVEAITLCAPK